MSFPRHLYLEQPHTNADTNAGAPELVFYKAWRKEIQVDDWLMIGFEDWLERFIRRYCKRIRPLHACTDTSYAWTRRYFTFDARKARPNVCDTGWLCLDIDALLDEQRTSLVGKEFGENIAKKGAKSVSTDWLVAECRVLWATWRFDCETEKDWSDQRTIPLTCGIGLWTLL